jgi:hypothetical protein
MRVQAGDLVVTPAPVSMQVFAPQIQTALAAIVRHSPVISISRFFNYNFFLYVMWIARATAVTRDASLSEDGTECEVFGRLSDWEWVGSGKSCGQL